MKELRPAIFVIGLPGSGKSTLTAILKVGLDAVVLSGGGLLRAATNRDPRTAAAVFEILENGLSAPDSLLIELFRERLTMSPTASCVLLDGTPGSREQFERILNLLGQFDFAADKPFLIHLNFDVEERRRRLACGRLICSRCGESLPDDWCSECGALGQVRELPTAEIGRKRAEVQERTGLMMLDLISSQGRALELCEPQGVRATVNFVDEWLRRHDEFSWSDK